jgi:hypothetical protein
MAAISKTKIINAMLVLIGSKKIFAPSDKTKAAIAANELYDVVTAELADIGEEWYFMEGMAQLSERGDSPPFGHLEKHYNLPEGFIDMVAVCDETGKDIEYEWERGLFIDSAGVQHQVLRTNQLTVFLKYIAEVTNPMFWPRWYIRLVVLRLAQYMVTSQKGEGNFINLTVGKAWDDAWKIAKKANAKGKRSRTGSSNKHEDLGSNDVIDAPGMGLDLLGDCCCVSRIES